MGGYLGIGLLFAIPFAFLGARKIDPAAAEGTWGFKLLIIPGSILFWPYLLKRWVTGGPPPEEGSPHRRAARHLGVAMFLLGLIHAALSVATYHAGASVNPIVSIFTQDAGATMGSFSFQAFGFGTLLILFVMAATSHDFWLANLTAPVWKALHMLVYLAYVALVVHLAFGVLQAETSPLYVVLPRRFRPSRCGSRRGRSGWTRLRIRPGRRWNPPRCDLT